MAYPTPLERAFQLARSGDHATVSSITKAMHREGFAIAQVEGPALRKELGRLCRVAQEERTAQEAAVVREQPA